MLINVNLCMDCGRKLAKNSYGFSFKVKTGVMLKENLDKTLPNAPSDSCLKCNANVE